MIVTYINVWKYTSGIDTRDLFNWYKHQNVEFDVKYFLNIFEESKNVFEKLQYFEEKNW